MSAQTLRRYAAFYERVYGPLPRRDGQRSFSQEVLERLRAAQAFVAEGRSPGMRGALQSLKDGPPAEIRLPPAPKPLGDEVLREVLEARRELNATREAVLDARQEVVAAGNELDRLVNALVELSERQVHGQEALEKRLAGIEAGVVELVRDVREVLDREPAEERVSPRSWWPFGRRRS